MTQNYELRPYQQELIDRVKAEWSFGNQRVMMQLPTGAGKTVLFSHVARDFLSSGQAVLVIAHRKELVMQAKEKLESVAGVDCGIIKAGFRLEEHLDV